MIRKLVCGLTNTVLIVNKGNKYKDSMLVVYIEDIVKRGIYRTSTNKLTFYF